MVSLCNACWDRGVTALLRANPKDEAELMKKLTTVERNQWRNIWCVSAGRIDWHETGSGGSGGLSASGFNWGKFQVRSTRLSDQQPTTAQADPPSGDAVERRLK